MTTHPRTLIRRAVLAVLKKSPAVTAICGQRIYPNRLEPWDEDELPAMGVYQTAEEPLETDLSPDPDERRLTFAFETLVSSSGDLEDLLDQVSLALERSLNLDAIGQELGKHDTLLELKYQGSELGLADEGRRLVGVAVLNFALDYAMPRDLPELDELKIAATGWDLAGSDPRVVDAEDNLKLPGWESMGQEETP